MRMRMKIKTRVVFFFTSLSEHSISFFTSMLDRTGCNFQLATISIDIDTISMWWLMTNQITIYICHEINIKIFLFVFRAQPILSSPDPRLNQLIDFDCIDRFQLIFHDGSFNIVSVNSFYLHIVMFCFYVFFSLVVLSFAFFFLFSSSSHKR